VGGNLIYWLVVKASKEQGSLLPIPFPSRPHNSRSQEKREKKNSWDGLQLSRPQPQVWVVSRYPDFSGWTWLERPQTNNHGPIIFTYLGHLYFQQVFKKRLTINGEVIR
jgi:hypothetical protein